MNVQASERKAPDLHSRDRTGHHSIPHTYVPVDAIPAIAWTLHQDGRIVKSNESWRNYSGCNADQSLAERWWNWLPSSNIEAVQTAWQESNDTRSKFELRCQLRSKDGSYHWHQISVSPPDTETSPHGLVDALRFAVCINIQSIYEEYTHLREESQIDKDLLNASVDCIKMLDLEGNLLHMNRSGCKVFGLPEDSKFGMKWAELVPPSLRKKVKRAISVCASGKRVRFSGAIQFPGEPVQHWDNILNPMLNSHGTPTAILCVSREITQQRAAEARLIAASEQDPLTGLLNRKALRAKTNRWISKAKTSNDRLALALIDLDHFKPVNDSYGHPVGDFLLKSIAKRLSSTFPEGTLISRIGGDEFAVVIRDKSKDRQALTEQLNQNFAELAQPIFHAGKQINSGMSVGIAFYPDDATEFNDLIRKSDVALTEAKNTSRGTVKTFCESMSCKNFCSLSQLNTVRNLLNKDSFEVSYTKRVSLNDESAVVGLGCELILKPELKRILGFHPTEILKSNHSISNEAAQLLRDFVVKDLSSWAKRRKLAVPVTLRTPTGELMRQDFADSILQQLDKHNVAPNLIEIEVHESIFSSRSAELAVRTLDTLRRNNIQVCLGDFGEGMTSLTSLSSYPIDSIRLSTNLTMMAIGNPVLTAIVRSICGLCQELHLGVSCRGLNTLDDITRMRDAGCLAGEGEIYGTLRTGKRTQKFF